MALHISFKPGKRQSLQAARYYHETVGGLVEALIDGLEQKTYTIRAVEGPSIQLRTWCDHALEERELHELFDWLIALRTDIEGLQEGRMNKDHIAGLVGNWLAVRLGGGDLFVELAIVHPEEEENERTELALGIVRGRSVIVSTDALLFTWLAPDVFGLSLAGRGSYLLELADGKGGKVGMRLAS
ncbi:MAG: hypothetical protein JNM31_12100 [Flavobacteriales bacterium]|nr:hypothetical protein [Flavobacteriales bacterium]